MAVNKNFVVKNGLEVNEDLIVANATDSFVGVGTSTPNNTLHVFGGIGATDVRITGFSSFIQSVFVGASGTTFAVIDTPGSNPQVGIGTDIPAYLLDIRSAVSTGQTALYVQGDARITGDLIADDITLDQANFTNINVTGFTTTSELVVGMGASVTGITTLGHLNRAAAGSGGTSVTFNPAAGIATNLQIIGNTYIEGDLKIQDDLEVDADLFIVGIITAGTVHVGSAFSSAGISTFMSDVNIGGKVQTGLEIAGVTTTASSGGITTTGGDLFVGNNLFIKDDITVDTNLNILGVATVGVLSARDAVVSGGATVNGNLTVGGDLTVTGDYSVDEISARNLDITGIATIHTLGVTSTLTATDLSVSAGATFGGAVNLSSGGISLGAGSTLGMGGSVFLGLSTGIYFGSDDLGRIFRDSGGFNIVDSKPGAVVSLAGSSFLFTDQTFTKSMIIATENESVDLYHNNVMRLSTAGFGVTVYGGIEVTDVNAAGIITASRFKGAGEVLGIGSEGTPIGSGVSFIDFRSSTGTAFSCQPAVNGIATVTVTPGVSLGLAIALGG